MLVPKPKSNPRAVPECTSVRQPGFGWPFQKGGAPDGGRSWRRGADRLTEKETSQQKKLKPRERSFWQMGWLRSGGFSAPVSRRGFHDVRADCWGGGPSSAPFLWQHWQRCDNTGSQMTELTYLKANPLAGLLECFWLAGLILGQISSFTWLPSSPGACVLAHAGETCRQDGRGRWCLLC